MRDPVHLVGHSVGGVVAALFTYAYDERVRSFIRARKYFHKLRAVFAQHRVHLIAGERSRRQWDVPDWAQQDAASCVIIPNTGHLMMIEKPATFAGIVSDLLRV